ncbi:MAG: L-threonylcarbamoyladenylate synthase [Granulosicoccaceae bacterium]
MSAATCNIDTAATIIKDGGVIAYPTEAVYGLGCDPSNLAALRRLIGIKKRAKDKGLILIASNQLQLSSFIHAPDNSTKTLMNTYWPGPVTLVVQSKATTNPLLTGGRSTLAVRVSDHAGVQALCNACDHALVSSSANLSGQTALRTSDDVLSQLGDDIDAVLEGGLGGLAKPTMIIDASSGKILRS